jgi:hypothetical protein
MSYEQFSKNCTIIQPGSVAFSCYYILSGVCRLQTIPQGKRFQALFPPTTPALEARRTKQMKFEKLGDLDNLDKQSIRKPVTISILSAGDCIGEFLNIRGNFFFSCFECYYKDAENRDLKVIIESMTTLKVLRVDKSQFLQAVKDLESQFTVKQDWLNSLPSIRTLPRYTIDCIAKLGVLRKYAQKSCVIRSGDAVTNNFLYFRIKNLIFLINSYEWRSSCLSSCNIYKNAVSPHDIL